MWQRNAAFTLVELLVVLVIMSTIILLSAPGISHFLERNRITTQVNQLVRVIHMAREAAIFRNRNVTLCRSDNGITCTGEWRNGMLLFVDQNEDRAFSENEELIYTFPPLPEGDQLYWRAFRNRQYLVMTPRGYTAWQNGTFTYCPGGELHYARGVILNAAGRIRITSDSDGDGIDEGANGRPLRC